jgi:hypothetical protein
LPIKAAGIDQLTLANANVTAVLPVTVLAIVIGPTAAVPPIAETEKPQM